MPRRTTPQLSEALAEYMLIRSVNCARTTVDNDRSVLGRFVRGVGDTQVHLLTPRQVEVWFAGVSQTQKASSFNKVAQRVRNFMEFCVDRGWLDRNPTKEVGTRMVRESDRLRLTAPQMRTIIEATSNPRDRAMLATACNTGLRASDLVGLKVGDVDLSQGELRVFVRKTGRLDFLPITHDLEVELRRWLSWYAERLAGEGASLDSDGYLFCALTACNSVRRMQGIELYGDPKPFVKQTHPARVVQRALLRIGVKDVKDQGFHVLRRSVGRTFFEFLAADGHDNALRITAALLGHKSVATTERYIGADLDQRKRNEVLRGRTLLADADASNVIQIGDRLPT